MQQFIGRVVQAARDNTAKIAVDRFVKHKKFLKVEIGLKGLIAKLFIFRPSK